ncbi:NAD-binding protein [candidate division KSB1 bacterium]|nr:NAD-binding protein [candidate division KSB1 bacterium]
MPGKSSQIIANILRSNLTKVFLGMAVVMVAGGMAVTLFEQADTGFSSVFDSIWWALVTMTTVGYGDKVPVSVAGRLIGIGVIICGVALVSMFTATVSSIFVANKIREGQGLKEVKFKNHLIICGWNFNAERIIEELKQSPIYRSHAIIMVNELPIEEVEEILRRHRDLKMGFVRGDHTKLVILERANVKQAAAVIVLPNLATSSPDKADEKTILATLTIKSENPNIKVYAHLLDKENEMHLKRADADGVIVSDEFSGFLLATHVVSPGIPQIISELLTYGRGNAILREPIPQNFVGKTFAELASYFKEKKDVILIGLLSEEDILRMDDVLSDDTSSIDAFIKRKFEELGKRKEELERIVVNINPGRDNVIQTGEEALVIGRPVSG